jgi:hypothetical protein
MAAVASKFYGGSSSDDSSDTDASSVGQNQTDGVQGTGTRVSRYAFESDTESDDEERIVLSKTQRTWEALQAMVKTLRNAMAISDWSTAKDCKNALSCCSGHAKQRHHVYSFR